ncbi:SET domain-containing protein 9 [Melia azedarach]|uniref:SET domain-containing protein 9 n=1 Tax=Melia azedarach TaxID=155640 RepID=A0ACC1XHK2_MELAZ|nr:SET domain-containing protein 9 [Melia azedarach]
MAFLFQKFQEGVKTLAKSPTFAFARNPRQLQFEADMNRLFLYTSYNRLGKDADEADAEEIIDMASKASAAEQQKQVQENIHSQITSFCMSMDKILLPDIAEKDDESSVQSNATPRRSGLSFAVGKSAKPTDSLVVHETRPLKRAELSLKFKDAVGYMVDVKPSQIPHKEAGQGLFLCGEANVGAVIAIYPGVMYSPAYYRYIPGYPRVDAQNPYLITRYDGTVINAQPWGSGGEMREVWDGLTQPEISPKIEGAGKGSDRLWKLLSKPLESTRGGSGSEALERRNPLALAHFANHPAKEEASMRRFGSFWFKWGSLSSSGSNTPILKTLVLVATRTLSDEEVLLNYRLSNSKRRPAWYTPVDEEEDLRRWS